MSNLRAIPNPLIIGHRGYCGRYPENTLISFEAAFAAGAGMIELDAALSKDREVVIIHDSTVDRTTNGTGPVKAHTLQRLKALDAGSWFAPRFAGLRIPTLAEVLEILQNQGLVNIEIKSAAFEEDDAEDSIERRIATMVKNYDLRQRVLISSFETRALKRFRDMKNPPALGVLTGRRPPNGLLELCRDLRAFSWHPHLRGCHSDLVSAAQSNGIKVFPYTANASADIRRLLRLEVDGFFTDDPAAAVEYVKKISSNGSEASSARVSRLKPLNRRNGDGENRR